jgi:benzoylformate decarboxylase
VRYSLAVTRVLAKKALIELLRAEGVEYVFGIPGATEIHFLDALEQAPDLQYVLALHEAVCVGMAEGYARVSGKPGFLNLHTGPGIAAGLPLLYNAYYGRVPLVVTVGQNDSRLLQRDPHLSGDIVGTGRLYAKWATEVVHADDIPTVLRRAFKSAVQSPSGPVVISLPQDVLLQDCEADFRPSMTVYPRLRPDREALARAVALLRSASRPVLMVESGVARSGAVEEVVRFAELTGARVYQAWMADVNFPLDHPQYLGDLDPTSPAAREVFHQADLLVGVGCSLFAEGFFSPLSPVPPELKVIHVDDDPWELGKNLVTHCGLQGDIRTVLAELNATLEAESTGGGSPAARLRAIVEEKAALEARFAQACKQARRTVENRPEGPVPVAWLMCEIKEALRTSAPEGIVVDECWSSSEALRHIVGFNRPGSYLRSRKGGSIGGGIPLALGAQLAAPERPVLAVLGDGGAAWSMQGLWTAARYRIPVTFVITNNATYRQVKLVRRLVLGDYPLTERHLGMEIDDPATDFSRLAAAMGVQAERVTEPGRVGEAVREALVAAREERKPRLVEVLVENPA